MLLTIIAAFYPHIYTPHICSLTRSLFASCLTSPVTNYLLEILNKYENGMYLIIQFDQKSFHHWMEQKANWRSTKENKGESERETMGWNVNYLLFGYVCCLVVFSIWFSCPLSSVSSLKLLKSILISAFRKWSRRDRQKMRNYWGKCVMKGTIGWNRLVSTQATVTEHPSNPSHQNPSNKCRVQSKLVELNSIEMIWYLFSPSRARTCNNQTHTHSITFAIVHFTGAKITTNT